MRHIKKPEDAGCAPASVAMVTGLTYRQVVKISGLTEFASVGGNDGMSPAQIVSTLRKIQPKRRWRTINRTVPTPFRHYTPRMKSGIIIMTRITTACVIYAHAVAYDKGWLLDPDSDGRIRLSDAKNSKDWRAWSVLKEITADPAR